MDYTFLTIEQLLFIGEQELENIYLFNNEAYGKKSDSNDAAVEA